MMTGKDKKGRTFYSSALCGQVMGGGARANKDGLNFASAPGSTTTSRLNAEEVEARYPILNLYTRSLPDSGGAGRFRGGVAAESVFKIHGLDQAEAIFFWTGRGVAANGICGGKPGSTPLLAVKKNTDVLELLTKGLPSWQEIKGEEEILTGRPLPFPLDRSDVVLVTNAGGGGYGDPLDREPLQVRKDVFDGYVSPVKAREDYGVVMNPELGLIDEEATVNLRKHKKRARKSVPAAQDTDSHAAILKEPLV